MTPSAGQRPMLTWMTQSPDRGWLAANGFAALSFGVLRDKYIAPARASSNQRATLASPTQALMDRFATHQAVAVLDVTLPGLEELRDLYGYALEPAWRAGCRLIVHADRTLAEIDPSAVIDPGFEHPWTLERARYLAATMSQATTTPTSPGDPQPSRALDPEQLAAVAAHDGAVQIVAPAGSGKTTVLCERVRELLRRGTPPEQILCTTFNRDAAGELRARLDAAGITTVEARTFHSVGAWILREERMLPGQPRNMSLGQWKRLCVMAQREMGEWIDPADAAAAVSNAKLGLLATPEEYDELAPPTPEGRAIAAIYRRYQAELRGRGDHDFDDQLMLAVRALRGDPVLRTRWQRRFTPVLVDEYQDIEPAQELLVQILAAPHDSIFTVGDPDQLIYGWRRASVERIISLDQTYPGLQRVALETNYRCPAPVVDHARRLIALNKLRFPLAMHAAPGRTDPAPSVSLDEHRSREAAAEWTARALTGRQRGAIAVLARTTRNLRVVAEACAPAGILISAPAAVFEARGAQAVVEAHLRLAANPASATPDDVLLVMRHPSRGLPLGAERPVAQALREGARWEEAIPTAEASRRLSDAADLFDLLRLETDAARFIRLLRRSGDVDRHFEEYERTFGGAEQTETEALEDAERQAAGKTVADYALTLERRRDALLAIRDDDHGIELTTVHRAKGREWPTVIVAGFDAGQMPHKRALQVKPEQAAAGEGLEAERRVAYVAITRARERLHLLTTAGSISQFAWEAGLADPPNPAAPPARQSPGPARRRAAPPNGPPGSDAVVRVGAKYAVRTAPTPAAGLAIAAWAIRHNLVGPDTAAADITVGDYLVLIDGLPTEHVDGALQRADVDRDLTVSRVPAEPRRRLADELQRLATRS